MYLIVIYFDYSDRKASTKSGNELFQDIIQYEQNERTFLVEAAAS